MLQQNRESGEVVVEASIVVTIVVIFISVFLYIGMILYQQSLVSIMANQTASNIAQVYSNSIKDPFTGYVDSDSVYQSITYGSMKNDAYVDVLTQKANTLAYYRLKSSRILTNGNPNVQVDIVKKPNELLKSQIVVTIRDKYQLPLVSFFGVDNELEFSATGRADCVDILEYLNGVEAIGDPEHSSVTYLPDSDTCLVQFFDNKVDNRLLATVPVLKGKSIITSNHYTHSTIPKNPTSDKFKFTGWATSDGTEFFGTTEISGNTIVYGMWECTVKFEPEGGTVSPTSKKVKVWTMTSFPTPTRSGWTFLGWFTQKNGGGVQYFSNATTINDNITLYAYWSCNHSHMQKVERNLYYCRDVGGQPKSYDLYRCADCGKNEKKVTIENKHSISAHNLVVENDFLIKGSIDDFEGQCDHDHLGGTAVGIDGSYQSQFQNRKYYHQYHITCIHCGKNQPKVYFDNIDGTHAYRYIYWHVYDSNKVHTACNNPNWISYGLREE